MRLTWAQPEDLLPHELVQSAAEGRDVAEIAQRWQTAGGPLIAPASGAGPVAASAELRALARTLLDELEALPGSGAPAGSGEQVVDVGPGEQTNVNDLFSPVDIDRFLGAWTGRAAGCLLGKPVEKIPREGIEEIARATGNWPISGWFTAVGLPADVASRWPWNRRSAPTSLAENIAGMPEDDDLNFPMLALDLVETHGRDFTTDDVATAWLANLPGGRVFTAERAAYRNLLDAYPVPETATHHNPFREWIGALIRADLYGWICPSDPAAAARMAWIDARLSHTGNGIYGAMWAAALASAALVAQDVAEVLDAAETVVPPGSHLAEAVRCGRSAGERARAAVDAGAEVEAALAAGLDQLHAAYGHLHWVHVLNNAATIAFALASGDGDFGVSVGAAVSAGWDTDSVGATVGGVVGALAGASGLPERWTTALEGRIATSLPGGERRIADLAARTRALSTATSTAEGSGTVVVVGSANVDLVVPVARHPGGGETLLGGDLRRNPGGKGANQAVAAARAGGARTSLIGAVGTDDAGDLLLASLASAGVRTDLVERHSQAPTGVALITVTGDGENAIVVAPGANALVRVGPEAASRIAAADVVLAQLETPLDAVRAAAAALSPGALLVLNAAPSAPLPDDVWSILGMLVVNEHEAADLSGCSDPEVAVERLLERVPAVVVTLGGAGSIVARRGEPPMRLPGVRVDVVDTTGAGDTFCGVLCAALAQGVDLADAVRRAGAAGALAVTRPGAQDAVPTAAEVRAFAAGANSPSGRDDLGGTR